MLTLYNTLTHQKELFKPINGKTVGLYTCGPTVYNYAHIGNLRTYVFEDILKRVLQYNGYRVKHVMNITDVGHLTSDADEGEDKMEKGAKREGKSAWDIAKFYTRAFQSYMKDLNILPPKKWCKATDHIPEQISLVKTLIKKGYTYETSDGIYFDTTQLDDYGTLANLQQQELKAGARVDIGEKKNPHDFALWKFNKPDEPRQMEWPAFGRMGFPGWHIECSAMAMKYLGKHFDIHCGGIDHVPVHHTNEIAQTEAATGIKPWVNVWMHGEFLQIADAKMAKSGGNFITLATLKKKGISPLAYRYFLLQTHYRKQLTFSWEALEAAQTAYDRMRKAIYKLKKEKNQKTKNFLAFTFVNNANDDLDTASIIAGLWEIIENKDYNTKDRLKFLKEADKILGLQLLEYKPEHVTTSHEVQKLLDQREQARRVKNWAESDRLGDEIAKLGYRVGDTKDGQNVSKI
jgi:cysteinyl-tRNA synthetase